MTLADRPIRLGLIGAGKHGRRYATHICNDFQDRPAWLIPKYQRDIFERGGVGFAHPAGADQSNPYVFQ